MGRGGHDAQGVGILPVNHAEHVGDQIQDEEIVRVREEAHPGDDNGADMVPAEGDLIDLGEGETPAQVGIGDVRVVIVEVVKGRIAAVGADVGERERGRG